MNEGIIATLNPKGFGFIKVEGMEKDVFFHNSDLVDVRIDDLREGDKLQFTIVEDEKGKRATQVAKVA